MPKKKYFKYGWNPDLPDHRDLYKAHKPMACPPKVDLRTTGFLPPIWDQGSLGSCVAHATAAAYEFILGKDKEPDWMPSRLFIYYNARVLENSVASDDGCQIRDAVKQLNSLGACHEDIWPYQIPKFPIKPLAKCYAQAKKDQVIQYSRILQTEQELEACLAGGYPICCGISLYESFETPAAAQVGLIPMPNLTERALGGHAVLVVGYDHIRRLFIMRNSWGEDWGDKGYFYLPYDYLLKPSLADDFWVLQQTN